MRKQMPDDTEKTSNGNRKNLHLQAGSLFVIRIKPLLCMGCDECMAACKHGVLERTAEGRVEVKNGDRCKGCLKCLNVCRTKAIHVLPGKGMGRTLTRS